MSCASHIHAFILAHKWACESMGVTCTGLTDGPDFGGLRETFRPLPCNFLPAMQDEVALVAGKHKKAGKMEV